MNNNYKKHKNSPLVQGKNYRKLKNEKEKLQNENNGLIQELDVFKERVRGLRWFIQQLDQQKNQKIDELDEKIEELEHELLLKEGEINALRDGGLWESLQAAWATQNNLRREVNFYKNVAWKTEIKKGNLELELQEQIRQQQIIIQQLNDHTNLLNQLAEKELSEATTENWKLFLQRLKEFERKKAESINNLQQQIDKLTNQLNDAINERNARANITPGDLTALQIDKEYAEANLESRTNERDAALAAQAAAEQERDQFHQQLIKTQSEKKGARDEVNYLGQKNDEKRIKISELDKEVNDLKTQLAQQAETINRQKSQLRNQRKEDSGYWEEAESSTSNQSTSSDRQLDKNRESSQTSNWENEVSELETETAELIQSQLVEELNQELKNKKGKVTLLERRLARIERENKNQEIEVNSQNNSGWKSALWQKTKKFGLTALVATAHQVGYYQGANFNSNQPGLVHSNNTFACSPVLPVQTSFGKDPFLSPLSNQSPTNFGNIYSGLESSPPPPPQLLYFPENNSNQTQLLDIISSELGIREPIEATKLKPFKNAVDRITELATKLGDLDAVDSKLGGVKLTDIPADKTLQDLIALATDYQDLEARVKNLVDPATYRADWINPADLENEAKKKGMIPPTEQERLKEEAAKTIKAMEIERDAALKNLESFNEQLNDIYQEESVEIPTKEKKLTEKTPPAAEDKATEVFQPSPEQSDFDQSSFSHLAGAGAGVLGGYALKNTLPTRTENKDCKDCKWKQKFYQERKKLLQDTEKFEEQKEKLNEKLRVDKRKYEKLLHHLKKLSQSKEEAILDYQNKMVALRNKYETELHLTQVKIKDLEYKLEVRTDQRDRARQKLKELKNKQQALVQTAEKKKVSLALIKYSPTANGEEPEDFTVSELIDTSNDLVEAISATQEHLGVADLSIIADSHKIPKGATLTDLINFYNNPPASPPPIITPTLTPTVKETEKPIEVEKIIETPFGEDLQVIKELEINGLEQLLGQLETSFVEQVKQAQNYKQLTQIRNEFLAKHLERVGESASVKMPIKNRVERRLWIYLLVALVASLVVIVRLLIKLKDIKNSKQRILSKISKLVQQTRAKKLKRV